MHAHAKHNTHPFDCIPTGVSEVIDFPTPAAATTMHHSNIFITSFHACSLPCTGAFAQGFAASIAGIIVYRAAFFGGFDTLKSVALQFGFGAAGMYLCVEVCVLAEMEGLVLADCR